MKAQFTDNVPVMMTVAGSDCSSGAGLQADIKSALAHDVYPLSVVTCVVAEIPGEVVSIQPVSLDLIEDQISCLLKTYPVGAIKTGMLYSSDIAEVVASCLKDQKSSLVVDPVMIASSGDRLMQETALKVYREQLLPKAKVVTPNLDELSVFVEEKVDSVDSLKEASFALSKELGIAVLGKGGHLPGVSQRMDVLVTPDGSMREYVSPYIENVSTHGTGCTYSAAIAAGLAYGLNLREAVGQAHEYVAQCIMSSCRWKTLGEIQALNHLKLS